jgi:hypothetical protein
MPLNLQQAKSVMSTVSRFIMRLVVFSALLFPLVVPAQEANWDMYTATYKKGTGSTLVDLSLKRAAPLHNLPYVVVTGVMCKDCEPDGMPVKSEFPKLYIMSDTVKAKMDKLVENRMVGTFTYHCDRLDYYYVADTSRIRERLTRLYQVYFPAYKPYIIIKTDRDWKVYKDILYPSEENEERMENEKVVIKLAEGGDHLELDRPVTHWLNFTSEKDRNCFMTYAGTQRFVLETYEKMLETEKLYKLKIIRPDLVDLNSITKITLTLRQQAKKCNGFYEGWEAPIVKLPIARPRPATIH